MSDQHFLHVKQAAALLGVAPNTVRNWGREGKLPEFRHPMNNYRLYRREDLVRILRRLRTPERAHARHPASLS
jgi:DNA-binding transcriptional MerR regulator